MKRYRSLFEVKNPIFNIKMEIEFAKRAKIEKAKMSNMDESKYWGDVSIYLSNFLRLKDMKKVKNDLVNGTEAEKYAADIILTNIKE